MTSRSPVRWRQWAMRCFSIVMIGLLSLSILSASHMELRPIDKNVTKFALDFDHKSTVVKPRPVFSSNRAYWEPLLVTLILFLLQCRVNPLHEPSRVNRHAHIPLVMKRLFLMPVKRTSTAI